MANRPRRPKSESGDLTTPGPQDVSDETSAPIASIGEPADPMSSPSETAGEPGAERGLPPREEQPLDDPLLAAQQKLGEDRRQESAEEASTVETFAAEEGLAAKAGEPPRRHLGEFEDDETMPDGAEPHPAPVTNAYSGGSERPITPETLPPSTFGRQFGAGLAGAVIALLGGTALLYSGAVPLPGSAASSGQYASAGDLEGVSSEVQDLRARVDQLQSADAAGGTGGFAPASEVTELRDRLTALEQSGSATPASAPAAPDASETLRPEIDSARDAATGAQDAANAAQTTADEARTLATNLDTQVSDFEARLASLEEAQTSARTALAAAGLKAAIDRGGPFMPELESFATAGGAPEAVESLRPFAAEGVPTQAEIAAEWPDAESAIRQATVSPGENAGFGDQLMAGLSSLVTVRSTGETAQEGEGPDAVLARMSAAVESGDWAAWRSEWDGLEPSAQEASRSFADRVVARQEASTVVGTALDGAVGANEG